MERGFFHPERDYWQTTGRDPTTTVLRYDLVPGRDGSPPLKKPVYIFETYPNGTIEVPLKPGDHYEWIDDKWVYQPPTVDELRAEMPSLSGRQFRLALIENEIALSQVDQTILEISDEVERSKAQVEWEYASEFQRDSPFVVSLAVALGLTADETDKIWRSVLNG